MHHRVTEVAQPLQAELGFVAFKPKAQEAGRMKPAARLLGPLLKRAL
jgi:hypothetical protein